MLVGAPNADAQPFHSQDSYRPGALYKCNVSPSQDDCQVIEIDNSGDLVLFHCVYILVLVIEQSKDFFALL